jgi:hypothetical protein
MTNAGIAVALLALAGRFQSAANNPELVVALSGKLAKLAALPDFAPNRAIEVPLELQLERIVSLEQAAELSGLSPDTWRRRFPEKIKRLSPRRVGVKLREALML